jgi:hypothetical protein
MARRRRLATAGGASVGSVRCWLLCAESAALVRGDGVLGLALARLLQLRQELFAERAVALRGEAQDFRAYARRELDGREAVLAHLPLPLLFDAAVGLGVGRLRLVPRAPEEEHGASRAPCPTGRRPRAPARARAGGSRNMRASSASVLTSETAVTRRTSARGSDSSAAGFFAETFACFVAGVGCCARTPDTLTAKNSATANIETLFNIVTLQFKLAVSTQHSAFSRTKRA